MSNTATVLVPVANGSESLETVTIVNVLRRAECEVTVASIEHDLVVAGTRDLRIAADRYFLDLLERKFDLIVLPGGEKGAERMSRHAPLVGALETQLDAGRWFAAICAAPAFVLAPHHLLDGRSATCYPAFRNRLPKFVDQPVVVDGRCVTSQGPATALPFALKLTELLAGAATAHRVSKEMLAG